jgi:hypothetical protein
MSTAAPRCTTKAENLETELPDHIVDETAAAPCPDEHARARSNL